MATATGMPPAVKTRKTIFSTGALFLFDQSVASVVSGRSSTL